VTTSCRSPVGGYHGLVIPGANTPGRVELHLRAVSHDEPAATLADGRLATHWTLSRLRERFGGDQGYLTDPYHRGRHAVHLGRWADANPETRIEIVFRVTPDRPLPLAVRRRVTIDRALLISALPSTEAEARTLDELLDVPCLTFEMRQEADGTMTRTPTQMVTPAIA
jgi:hypothetical protein